MRAGKCACKRQPPSSSSVKPLETHRLLQLLVDPEAGGDGIFKLDISQHQFSVITFDPRLGHARGVVFMPSPELSHRLPPRAPLRLHHRFHSRLQTAPLALPVTHLRCVADHRPTRCFGLKAAYAFTEVLDAEVTRGSGCRPRFRAPAIAGVSREWARAAQRNQHSRISGAK